MTPKEEKELDYLIQKDLKRINAEILSHKKKTIEEIKQLNKDEMFPKEQETKISFFKRISKLLGI